MINLDTDISPIKIAKWLQVASSQRSRAQQKAINDFGSESASAIEIGQEIQMIGTLINKLTQLQAEAPLKPRR